MGLIRIATSSYSPSSAINNQLGCLNGKILFIANCNIANDDLFSNLNKHHHFSKPDLVSDNDSLENCGHYFGR
jgi:hypothetical protein